MKQLTINGVIFAEYLIENDTIFLKMLKKIVPSNAQVSENVLILIAQSLEEKKFERASYLNN